MKNINKLSSAEFDICLEVVKGERITENRKLQFVKHLSNFYPSKKIRTLSSKANITFFTEDCDAVK